MRAIVVSVILAAVLTLLVCSEQVRADTSAPPTVTAPPYVPLQFQRPLRSSETESRI